jgi:hypothetical protein
MPPATNGRVSNGKPTTTSINLVETVGVSPRVFGCFLKALSKSGLILHLGSG